MRDDTSYIYTRGPLRVALPKLGLGRLRKFIIYILSNDKIVIFILITNINLKYIKYYI